MIADVSDGVGGDQEQDAAAQPQDNYLISLSRENPHMTVLTKEGQFKAPVIDAE